ncbi:phosphoenolpyruvate carboxykinase (ATP) [Tellurirhabdus bombi]|uniref:hypothetical protein n=1 Tax=Tellurirhabdus bombi TaxID=2907205 RepID=UPI001F3A9AE8|nr:hypothetical protein [Tellurirhabdus bombi]
MNVLLKSEVASFLEATRQRVEDAKDVQRSSYSFDWANHRVGVELVGIEDTAFFTDAIAHRLTAAVGSPELMIYVVDDSQAQAILPEPFWDPEDLDPYGRLQGLDEGEFAEYSSFNQVFTVINRKAGLCVIWVRDVASLPEWERSFPFRTVLYQWFKNSSFLFVHAGAVGNENGGVLLTGKGGMGKSTATLSCLGSELRYAGDDFVMIDTENLEVHSLYNVAKLEASNLHRFPHLVPFISNKASLPQEKGQVFLHFCNPGSLILHFPIKAIFLPRFTGQETTALRPATKAEALRALAPSTIGLLKAETSLFAQIARLVHQLPCYWIETGTQLETIPATIFHWLNEHKDA